MKEFVNIKISGKHLRDGETEKVNVNVSGNYFFENGMHKVSYIENVDGFDEVIINTYSISENRIEIVKEGLTNSRMIFSKKNPVSKAIYKTPYGELSMQVVTNFLLVDFGENEINTEMDYSLFVDEVHTSDVVMHINISVVSENSGNDSSEFDKGDKKGKH